MIEINHLRYFYEVAKAKSFTAAAKNLRVSQSALSRIVALLEAREGVKLLERSKKGVSLTPIGQLVYQQSGEIFASAKTISDSIKNYKQVCEGHLKFGASDHIVNYLILPHLNKINAAFPKLIPSIFTSSPSLVTEKILQDELEFGINFQKTTEPSLVSKEIASMQMAIVYNPNIIKYAQGSKLAKFFDSYPYICSPRSSTKQSNFSELLQITSTAPNVKIESNSQETQKRMCLEGLGYAYLAKFMLQDELDQKLLVSLPVKPEPKLGLYLTYKKNRALSFNATTFLRQLSWVEAV